MDKIDTVTLDVPLFIRALEHAREDLKTDADLHVFVERVIQAAKGKDVLTMDDYAELVPSQVMAASRLIAAEKWSGDVKEKHHTPPDLFKEGSADKIAKELKKEHGDDFAGAMSALNFYLNRAGKNLSEADRKRVESAKGELRKLYGKE